MGDGALRLVSGHLRGHLDRAEVSREPPTSCDWSALEQVDLGIGAGLGVGVGVMRLDQRSALDVELDDPTHARPWWR